MDDFCRFLVADNTTIEKENDLFGQLIGAWNFKWYWEDMSGNGNWIFSRILQGRGVQDVFIWPTEKGVNNSIIGEYGTTIRIYNETTLKWDIYYVNGKKASIGIAHKAHEDIVIDTEPTDEFLVRWTFSNITKSSFTWTNSRSADKGHSWEKRGELFANRQ